MKRLEALLNEWMSVPVAEKVNFLTLVLVMTAFFFMLDGCIDAYRHRDMWRRIEKLERRPADTGTNHFREWQEACAK